MGDYGPKRSIEQLEKMVDTHNILPSGEIEIKKEIIIPDDKEWQAFYAGFMFADKIIHQEPKWNGDLTRISDGFKEYND